LRLIAAELQLAIIRTSVVSQNCCGFGEPGAPAITGSWA